MELPRVSSEISHMGVEALIEKMGSDSENGLNSAEASTRLKQFGPNALIKPKSFGFVGVLIKELREPMILLLVIIAAIYSVIGDPRDSVVIVVIVFLVVFIETYNVNKARRSIDALRELSMPVTSVVRDGTIKREKTGSIVPGDIVILSSGERIPADGRLIESFSLKIDESALTGESFSVIKDAETIPESIDLAELSNMVFSGSLVIQGSGRYIVTATGKGTEIGKISELIEQAEEAETPLGESLSRLTKILAILAITFSLIVPLLGFLQGQTVDEMILTGLSMAFATVPEELPVLVSITLAIGAYTLSRHNAVVKDLKAAETLGSVTVIATDKTGTITENKMAVGHVYCDGRVFSKSDRIPPQLMETTILATGTTMLGDAKVATHKDPMEIAAFLHAEKQGVDLNKLRGSYRLVDEFSFDNKIKLSSYLYDREDGTKVIYVEGAPEVVLSRSIKQKREDGNVIVLTEEGRDNILEAVDSISAMGERLIAIGTRNVTEDSDDRNVLEKDLIFHGMVSFIDPPRSEVPEAIRECQLAGIRVIMLTGDHPKTAKSIATQVGINHSDHVVTGSEIAGMDDDTLAKKIIDNSIFARITSEDKFRIVQLLRKNGETVAVTGDGVNDSPALQNAEIGIAMGIRGTDVAREASDMILLDDNFATIVQAVHEGRGILYTLRKSLKYEISIKLALVMILTVPLFLFIPFPFSPIQIIVMELMMDVAAMGGFLYEREEVGLVQLQTGERSKNFINWNLMSFIILASASISIAVTAVYLYIYYTSGFLLRAQTAAFSVWMLSQIFLAHNLRTEKQPVFMKGILSNKVITLWGIIIAAALVIITVFPDLQILLHTIYLTYQDWAIIIVVSIISTFWIEALKTYRYFRDKHRAKLTSSG